MSSVIDRFLFGFSCRRNHFFRGSYMLNGVRHIRAALDKGSAMTPLARSSITRGLVLGGGRFLAAFILLIASTPGARAQWPCSSPDWKPGANVAGVDGTVQAAALWDPDGPGPLGPRVIIAGQFSLVRDVPASNIAAW